SLRRRQGAPKAACSAFSACSGRRRRAPLTRRPPERHRISRHRHARLRCLGRSTRPARSSTTPHAISPECSRPPARPLPPRPARTGEDGWAAHARFFDRAFGELDRTQLAQIRAWSNATLRQRRPTMFYMFSGPDFLYADAFFPGASTYVLAGLEPVGQIPDLERIPRGSIGPALANIANSLHSILSFSFFITHNMRSELSTGQLGGTTPILYVFLARAGKTVREAKLVALDVDGSELPD